jgi:hypothetical protein
VQRFVVAVKNALMPVAAVDANAVAGIVEIKVDLLKAAIGALGRLAVLANRGVHLAHGFGGQLVSAHAAQLGVTSRPAVIAVAGANMLGH